MNHSIHKERIAQCASPGNVVVRLCTLNACLLEEVLSTVKMGEHRGYAHAEITNHHLDKGETVWCYFYDGDSGECMKTLITCPAQAADAENAFIQNACLN